MSKLPFFDKEALKHAKPEVLLKEAEDWHYIATLQASYMAYIEQENDNLKKQQKFSLN